MNIESQLEQLFVHPWALNVPINSKDYLESTLPSGDRPSQKDYLRLDSTRKFLDTIEKGPLNS